MRRSWEKGRRTEEEGGRREGERGEGERGRGGREGEGERGEKSLPTYHTACINIVYYIQSTLITVTPFLVKSLFI